MQSRIRQFISSSIISEPARSGQYCDRRRQQQGRYHRLLLYRLSRFEAYLSNASESPRNLIASTMEQRTSEGATVELSADARRRRASLLILIPLTGNNNTITSNTLLAAFSWPVCAGGRVHYGLRVMKSVMMMCLTRAKIDSLEQCASAPITIT